MDENEQQSAGEIIKEIEQRPCATKNEVQCRRILVPVDGSGEAFEAIKKGIELAAATGAELLLLMVVNYDEQVAGYERVSLSGYVPAELKIDAYRYLADIMHVIPPSVPAQIEVEIGEPAETILSVAEIKNVDLIVMGRRGMDRLHRLLMGSVSTYVVQHAHCPVLFCNHEHK